MGYDANHNKPIKIDKIILKHTICFSFFVQKKANQIIVL